MTERSEQIQILYEIITSIDTELDLQEMLKKCLSIYVRKLNCSAGAVFKLNQYSHGENYCFKEIISIPRRIHNNSVYKNALKKIPQEMDKQTLNEFYKQLPASFYLSENQHCHIMNLPGFGLIIFLKGGKPAKVDLLNLLLSLNKKIADACKSCLNIEALRESEEKYREMADLLPQIIYETDIYGNFTFVNKQALESFGYSQEEYEKGINVLQTLITEDKKRAKVNMQNILYGKNVENPEYTALRKDGSTLPILIYSDVILKDNKPVGLRGIIIDITERKQAEEALKESNENFQQVVSNITTAIWKADIGNNGAFENTYTSPVVDELLGLPAGTIKNDWNKYFSYIKPEYLERVNNAFREAIMLPNKKIDCEYEVLKDNVQTTWFHSNGRCFEKNGKLHVFGSTTDITEQKKAEEKIKAKSLFLESLIQQSPLPTFVMDSKGFNVMVNEAFLKFYAVPNKEMILGRNALTEPANIKQGVVKYFKEALKGKIVETPEIEFVSPYKNKKIITRCRMFPILDTTGTLTNVVVMQEDITERKQAEEALQESEEKYRLLAENTIDCIWKMDKTLRFTYINPSVYAMFGFTPEEWVGSTLAEHCSKEEMRRIMGMIAENMKNENYSKTLEMLLIHKDGREISVEIRSKILIDENKELIGLQGTTHDITERKKAEEELKKHRENLEELVKERTAELEEKTNKFEKSQKSLTLLLEDVNESRAELDISNTKLESANKELESFSYSVSHDLRAPLRAIDGFSRLILEDYYDTLDDEGKESLNIIRNNTKLMGQLIDDLLEFSRLGRKSLKSYPIKLKDMINEIFHEQRNLFPNRIIDIKLKSIPDINGDNSMIRQVIVNLISNAVKFTANKKKSIIEFGSKKNENEIIYYIKDNGVGFDMQYVDKLFGVFQRLHSREEFEGTGVGLALVKRIINKHGGKVLAEGEENKGATFYFSMPFV